MKILIITKIFPNQLEPGSAPFNRQQFALLKNFCDLEVLATIPWFPLARTLKSWSAAGRLTGVPKHEIIDGLSVHHPRTLFVPRFAPGLSGLLYAASLLPAALTYRGKVDAVLGSWAYPDGFAAVQLAELLGVPAVIKLHGSDINVVAEMPGPKRRLQSALPRAARIVAVSRQLAQSVCKLGVDPARVDVVANGVNPELFHPRSRSAARRELDLAETERVILYVGRLEREKGVNDLLAAFERIHERDSLTLALLGDGRARAECEALAARLRRKVRVLGARPLREIPTWLAACNVLCLPSWNEGMPNAVLEALASGRRVVATRVGAIPDLVFSEALGKIVERRAPVELSEALLTSARESYDPAEVARLARIPSWQESAAGLYASLLRARETKAAMPSAIQEAA